MPKMDASEAFFVKPSNEKWLLGWDNDNKDLHLGIL
jgi:hypothetical protein